MFRSSGLPGIERGNRHGVPAPASNGATERNVEAAGSSCSGTRLFATAVQRSIFIPVHGTPVELKMCQRYSLKPPPEIPSTKVTRTSHSLRIPYFARELDPFKMQIDFSMNLSFPICQTRYTWKFQIQVTVICVGRPTQYTIRVCCRDFCPIVLL